MTSVVSPDLRPGVRRRRRIGHLLGLALFMVMLGLWVVATFREAGIMDRDWVAFDDAGWRALGGDWAAVYRGSADASWPYLYPPFTIYLSLPLGLLPFLPSYLAAVAMILGALACSARLIFRASIAGRDRQLVFLSAMLCAPTVAQVIITGQYSWVYLLSLAAAAAAWQRGEHARGGLWLAGLLVKPNVAIVFVPLLVAQRRWRELRAMALGGLALVAVTVPFGVAPWTGFVGAVRRVASQQQGGDAPIDKQATVLSFLQVLSGRTSTTALTWLGWVAVSAVLAAFAVLAWRRAVGHPSALRVVGLGALLCVAANPRLYFYDALVLVLPAAGWYLDRASYGSRVCRRLGGLCILTIVVSSLLFYGTPWAGTLIGPASALWLLAEARDLRRARPVASAADRPTGAAAAVGVGALAGSDGVTVGGPVGTRSPAGDRAAPETSEPVPSH